MSQETSGNLTVRSQVRLGFTRTAEICLNGIYYRLFRSLVTVSIVSVAIAFMMYMLAGSVIGTSVNEYARVEAFRYKIFDRWLSWIDEPLGRRAWFRLLADSEPGDDPARAAAQWGDLSESQLTELLATAKSGERYLQFFERLSPGKKLMLTEGMEHAFLPDWLQDETSRNQFFERLHDMASARLPGNIEQMQTFLEQYGKTIPLWTAVERGRTKAIEQFHARYPGQTTGGLLITPPSNLAATLQELGFAGPSINLPLVSEEGQLARQISQMEGLLRATPFREDIARYATIKPVDVDFDVLIDVYLARKGAAHVRSSAERHGLELPADDATVREILSQHRRRSRVLQIESQTAGFGEGWLGFSTQTLWLIGVSFVVCIVGIANAMLMSVMERFREIATMKCLGATDGFVMLLFVLESCIQGVVGGLSGALLGLLLSLPDALMKYGRLVWTVFPVDYILMTALIAMVTGIGLAAVASVYPAHVAARLVPMEAMQIE